MKSVIQSAYKLVPGAVAVFALTSGAHAQTGIFRGTFKTKAQSGTTGLGLGTADPITIVATLIQSFLVILGLIAIVIIIKAGIQWMLSQGNTDTIDKAKRELQWAAIGLLVILASYSLADYIFTVIENATGQLDITVEE